VLLPISRLTYYRVHLDVPRYGLPVFLLPLSFLRFLYGSEGIELIANMYTH